jgi:hypothetical protein
MIVTLHPTELTPEEQELLDQRDYRICNQFIED